MRCQTSAALGGGARGSRRTPTPRDSHGERRDLGLPVVALLPGGVRLSPQPQARCDVAYLDRHGRRGYPGAGAGEARVCCASPGAREGQRALALLLLRALVEPLLLALPLLATTPVGSLGRSAAWRSLAAISAISSGSGPGAKTAVCGGRSYAGAPSGWDLLGDLEVLAGLGVRPVEHGRDLLEVLRREAVELEVLAALDVRLALGDLVGRDPRRGEELHELRAGQVLQRAGVGDLMHAAADQQVAGQRACRRVVDHLVDLELVVARAGLEEEVVRQVLDEVTRGEHVVAVPGLAHGVLDEGPGAAGDEVLGVARALDVLQRARLARGRRRPRRSASC